MVAATLCAVKRSSVVMVLVALLVLGASAWFLLGPQQGLPTDPLAAIPADSYGLVRIRVKRLLDSEAWKRLVVAKGEARGIEQLTKTCGFNPLDGIDELVVFARPSPQGGTPRFAFLARGPLKHEQLIDCVRKVTGNGPDALTQEDVEGITTVRSKKGSSRAAFVGRDGVVGGDSESVRAVINTIVGKAPSAAKDPLLSQLYREGSESTDIQLVARLPKEFLPLVSALAQIGNEQLAALGGIKGLSGTANLVQEKITGGITLYTDSPAQATNIVSIATAVRSRILEFPALGLTGLSGPLRTLQMDTSAERAVFAGTVSVSNVETVFELVPALMALGEQGNAPEQRQQDAQPEPAPSAQPEPAAQPSAAPNKPSSKPTVESLAPSSSSGKKRRDSRER